MPDVHWGYGFLSVGSRPPTSPRAAWFSPAAWGSTFLRGPAVDLRKPRWEAADRLDWLMDQLDRVIPRGASRGGVLHLTGPEQVEEILLDG
jgi:tRNA-splicing ligase RtcB (3'-phosphate/5'-hydroxy nucleic acid ligase)